MKRWLQLTACALAMSFSAFAFNGPQKMTDAELNAVAGGQLAICCAECHGHGGGTIHCTGCYFCDVVIIFE